jgi:hypothetical protein
MAYKIFEYDPQLLPYKKDIDLRMKRYRQKREELVGKGGSLRDFANGYQYFGFHRTEDGWVYREWAPAAEEVYLTGDMVDWRWLDLRLEPIGNGVFEIRLPDRNALWNGCRVKTIVRHGGELLERVSRKGRKFFGCEKYPECDFVSWDRPVNENCPVCGAYMVFKRGAKETFFHVCSNETCRHRIQVENNGGSDDE